LLLLASPISHADESSTVNKVVHKNKFNEQTMFFKRLTQLCGNSYIGETIYPNVPTDPFVGVKLAIDFKQCNDTEIRVPFQVGDDTSRTWIITQTEKGLLLKHDHRHKDGTPDKVTMYGGYADSQGSLNEQSFRADEQTVSLIPAAKTNVWKLSLNKDTNTLTYYLERNSSKRYKAVFDLTPTTKE